jgi:glutathione S-transferase
MTLDYFGHPFSSYTWKGEIALIEKDADYRFRNVDPAEPDNGAELARLSPSGKFPLLVDGERVLYESSIIIEYVDRKYPDAPRLIPDDPPAALQVRLMDRMFDNHVMGNAQAIVSEYLPFVTEAPDRHRIDRAKQALSKIYGWLETALPDGDWACGAAFTLADCAAAPALFYADWVHPIEAGFPALRAYRARLLARPSVARCVEAARPYRHYFPLGAPERD